MKRILAMLLALAALLLSALALAEQPPVQVSGALAAYVDGEGQLFLPGGDEPINTANADALISIDAYRVLFTAEVSDGLSDLYMIDLDTFAETRVAKGVHAAAMADEDTLYYVPAAERTQLWRMSMADMTPELAYTAAEPIDRLYAAAEGLVFDQVDGMGAMCFDSRTGKAERYAKRLPDSALLTDDYELTLTDGEMTLRDAVSMTEEHVDSGVLAYVVMDGKIYYLANTGSAVRLKGYDPEAMTWQVLLTLDGDMEHQLAATAGKLFMIDSARQVYTVDTANGALTPFAKVGDPKSYGIPSGYDVTGLKIYGMEGQLNVYAALEEASDQPNFSFIEFTSTSDSETTVYKLLETYEIDGEAPAWTYLKPAVQYSPLSRGSRGDAVRAIQQPLYDLGYYDYYIDGIFGPRTQYAVELLQADLNRDVTGVADSELQKLLLDGNLPHYDAYMALTRGSRGMRVQIMQERLRELGYLADAADGIYGANTQRAVQLFQSENGLRVSDGATRETLKLLYSDDADECASYIDLYRGNTGIRVRALNNRLEELYYLEDNSGSVYTAATAEAVRAFQRAAGLNVDGNATAKVQRRLFSSRAPEAPGYITLSRGDENSRVEALQRRLKELNYYNGSISGYFGASTEKAVKLFQRRVDIKPTGVATVRTQTLLFRKDAPEYVPPTIIGVPEISVEPYDYFDGKVYYITDDNDYVTFNWYAEGDVESYNVTIKNAKGRKIFDEDTYMTRTGVSIGTLDYDGEYAMTVTAYPEDGDRRHITSATLRFVRVNTWVDPVLPVGEVGEPEITLEPVTRVQDGVTFIDPKGAKLHMHADGELDHYYVDIVDTYGETYYDEHTTSETLDIDTSGMAIGEVYTVFVYAIPTNGTLEDDATTVKAQYFMLEDASIPPEPTEPDDEPEDEPVAITEPNVDSEDSPTTDAGDDDDDEPVTPPQAGDDGADEPVTPPQAGDDDADEPEPALPVPVLSFEEWAGERDGITYVKPGTVVLRWKAEGIEQYEITVRTSGEDVVAHAETDKTALSVKSSNLMPGEVYTLTVIPVSSNGTPLSDATASGDFALYQEEDKPDENVEDDESVEDFKDDAEGEKREVVEEDEAEYDEDYADVTEVEEPLDSREEAEDEEPSDSREEAGEEAPEAEPNDEADIEDNYAEDDDAGEYDADEYDTDEYDGGEYDGGEYDGGEYDGGEYDGGEDYEADAYDEPDEQQEDSDEREEEPAPASDESGLDASTISQVQRRLVSWGWLEDGSFESGALDGATAQAVREFQSWYNDTHGGSLSSPQGSIGSATLDLLLNSGEAYTKE